MPNSGHISDERLDVLGAGTTPTDVERDHLTQCHRCARLLHAFGAVSTALSQPWTSTLSSAANSHRYRGAWAGAAASLAISALITVAIVGALIVSRPVTVGESPSPVVAEASPTHSPRVSLGVSNGPSAEPAPTPVPSTALESASPGPGLVISNVVGFLGWSPDGQHFAVAMPEYRVIDLSGRTIGTIPAFRLAWAANDQLAGFGDFGSPAGPGKVSWYDLQGNRLGGISSAFDSVRFAPGTSILVGVAPPSNGNSVGTEYQIWDGSKLSPQLTGVPLNWSDDGSRLTILAAPTAGGTSGTLAVVDAGGKTIQEVSGWTADFRSDTAFSHDNLYLAACLTSSPSQYPQIRVIDMATAAVSDSLGNCGTFSWTSNDELYASTFGDAQPKMWTPGNGVADAGIAGTTAVAAGSGNVAYFSNDSVLHVRTSSGTVDYSFAGPIQGLEWNADGSALAVVASASADTSPSQQGSELTIINVGQ